MRLFSALSVRRLTFGLGEGCDYTPGRLTYDEYGHASFDLCFHGDVLGQITLQVPGEFQVYNAPGPRWPAPTARARTWPWPAMP